MMNLFLIIPFYLAFLGFAATTGKSLHAWCMKRIRKHAGLLDVRSFMSDVMRADVTCSAGDLLDEAIFKTKFLLRQEKRIADGIARNSTG